MNFEQWFAQRYPKIHEAVQNRTAAGNELWILEATREAFQQGQLSAMTEQAQHGQLGTEQTDT